MSAYRYGKELSILAVAAGLALLGGRAAGDSGGMSTVSGEAHRLAVVCSNPFVARDLIGVIDQESTFRTWLHGYAESGYCVPADPGSFELAQDLGLENTASDGAHAELWAVYLAPREERHAIRYAIVFPETMDAPRRAAR